MMRFATSMIIVLLVGMHPVHNSYAEAKSPMEERSDLVQLAESKFGPLDVDSPLRKLVSCVEKGERAVFSDYTGNKLDISLVGSNWDAKAILLSEHIEWLCDDPDAAKLITRHGIQIEGARVEGTLNLAFSEISYPLVFLSCSIPSGLDLTNANIKILALNGSRVGTMPDTDIAVKALGTTVLSDILLVGGFETTGQVLLGGAKIGGALNCSGGVFRNHKGFALHADRASITGGVFLNDFLAEGEVRFVGATIGSNLDANRATFQNPGHFGLNATNLRVDGAIIIKDGSVVDGELRLIGARIGSSLELTDTTLNNVGVAALSATRIIVGSHVVLGNGFTANGKITLTSAEIDGNLECTGAVLNNPAGVALNASGITVKGIVLLNDKFTSIGEVHLIRANLSHFLNCSGSSFSSSTGRALDLEGATIGSSVFLNSGFLADGEVRLFGTKEVDPENWAVR